MRFIIYGAGAIGGTVGGHLALGGREVLFVGRSGHVQAIRQQGFQFVTPEGTHTLRVPATTGAADIMFRNDDVVLLCVKSQDTEKALEELSSRVADVPIFCFQNGVRNEKAAARHFQRVYGVMVRIGGTYLRDGEVIARRDPPGAVVIGRFPQGLDPLAESVAAALRKVDFAVLAVPDVMRYKWGKLMANLGNAVGAITNARDEDTEKVAEAARAEARTILVEAGIDWFPHDQLSQEWSGLSRPVRRQVDIQAYSSTWQSLMRAVGTAETEYLNGEIVQLGEQVGKPAPINSTLTRIVLDMAERKESPGRYTPVELCALLGLGSDTERS
jgi:2-dehydropantoate 2-reductase